MRKYSAIFSSFHTIYRLITTSSNIKNFAVGVCRVYKNVLKVNTVVLICKNVDAHRFMKIRVQLDKQYVKVGGISILTQRERALLEQGKEIIAANRIVYPFGFGDSLGIVYIKRKKRSDDFNELERRWFLSLSEEISIGLKIFHLYREEHRIMINYIKSLTKLLQQHVPTSSLHAKCIFRLIKILGKELKLSEIEIKSLEYAALLHDAGKLELPIDILKKQKPLTDEEYKLIMKHPRQGVELIKNLEVLKPAVPIILHHHERYDGKGYPYKLRKEQIPIGARILAVVDAFDAMYFGRPYKKRKYLNEIEEEFKKQMGKQFDPKIIIVFLKIMRRNDIRSYLTSFS